MASNLCAWVVPILLIFGCTTLVMNIFQARKVNKSLVEDIEKAHADLLVASGDSTAKDQQVASLTEQISQMTAELAAANAVKIALHEEMDKLHNQLEAAKVAAGMPAEVTAEVPAEGA